MFIFGTIIMPSTAKATCSFSLTYCPLHPSYTLSDIIKNYLANGDPSSEIQTNETQCIEAGKVAQLQCGYDLPMTATFSSNNASSGDKFLI